MANEIKLEIYTIRVREIRAKEHLKLDSFHADLDFLNLFQEYITTYSKGFLVNENQKKSLEFISNSTKLTPERQLSGIVESGDYGVESKIVDRKSRVEKYRKKPDDLDIKPFYYLLYIPENFNVGYLILQRLGAFGIYSIFISNFKEYFRKNNPSFIVEFNPHISETLAKTLLKDGVIRELSLRRYNLPKDVIDKLGMTGYKEDILSIELRITSKPKHFLPINKKIQSFVDDSNAKLFDVPELENLGFDGDHKSSIKVRYNNTVRTVDLSETGQIRPYYDIDVEVEKEKGHPKFQSIDRIAKDLLSNLV